MDGHQSSTVITWNEISHHGRQYMDGSLHKFCIFLSYLLLLIFVKSPIRKSTITLQDSLLNPATRSLYDLELRHAVVIELCKRSRITLAANGYFKSRLAVNKYCKHGLVSLHIPHDPPLDITIYQDIALNPGPTGEIFSQQTRTLTYRNFHTGKQSLSMGCWNNIET